MAKIIARRTKFGFQATLLSISMLSDGAYVASDGEGTIRDAVAERKSVTLPMRRIVAKSFVLGAKTAILLLKLRQVISVVTRHQMDSKRTIFISKALNYTNSVFTNYLDSSNRNDEVVSHRFCYISNKLRKNTSNLKGASVQFNVNNLTMSPPAVEKKRASTATTTACSPRPAIANNTWYPAPLAARSHVAVGIFLLSGKGEKLAPTPTRGT